MTDKALPKGKMWFVHKIKDLLGGDLDKITQRALDTGVSAVLIKAADGVNPYNLAGVYPFYSDSILGPLVTKLHLAGIEAWGWHYVYGTNPAGEADRALTRIQQLPWDGWIVDAEKECKQPGRAPGAALYMDRLRLAYPKLIIGLTSYRYPALHPELPWAEFLKYCNFAMPQVYWMQSHNPVFQLNKTLTQYQELYARLKIEPLPIIPAGAAFHEHGWQSSPAEIIAFSEHVQALGLVGCSWWEWASAYRYGLEDAVAKLDWPAPPPFEPPAPLPPPEPPGPTLEQRLDKLEAWAETQGFIK